MLDGELVVPGQTFETLQLQLHPAASRVAYLSGKFPTRLVVFDLLVHGSVLLTGKPLAERRKALEAFAKVAAGASISGPKVVVLSKATHSITTARRWLGLEGVDDCATLPLLPVALGRELTLFTFSNIR